MIGLERLIWPKLQVWLEWAFALSWLIREFHLFFFNTFLGRTSREALFFFFLWSHCPHCSFKFYSFKSVTCCSNLFAVNKPSLSFHLFLCVCLSLWSISNCHIYMTVESGGKIFRQGFFFDQRNSLPVNKFYEVHYYSHTSFSSLSPSFSYSSQITVIRKTMIYLVHISNQYAFIGPEI